MTTNDPTKLTLAQLGADSPDKLPALFGDLRKRFETEIADLSHLVFDDRAGQDALRLDWLGRKSGVLTRITDNWLKPASPELKRVVGQELNQAQSPCRAGLSRAAESYRGRGRKNRAGSRQN